MHIANRDLSTPERGETIDFLKKSAQGENQGMRNE
jgi:hypothetical protein